MTQTHRFGRRLALPATVQILHELLAFSARAEASKRQAGKDAAALPVPATTECAIDPTPAAPTALGADPVA